MQFHSHRLSTSERVPGSETECSRIDVEEERRDGFDDGGRLDRVGSGSSGATSNHRRKGSHRLSAETGFRHRSRLGSASHQSVDEIHAKEFLRIDSRSLDRKTAAV